MFEAMKALKTSGLDVLLAAYQALQAEERDEAARRIRREQLARHAGEEGETARYLASLRRVAKELGHPPGVDDYRRVRRKLKARGETLDEVNAIIRHFGRWALAKEALDLSESQTARLIEARFRKRLTGKVQRFRTETLREALARATEDIGHVPLVTEYKAWRDRELELAKARGEFVSIPSDSPFRRRFGTWEKALRHFGYSEEEIEARLEPSRERSREALRLSGFRLI